MRFNRKSKSPLAALALCALLSCAAAFAQTQAPSAPLTSDELVRLVRQLPQRPGMKDQLIEEIRRRGIGFPLTGGLLSVVATKSGNDVLLRRTLEEAERRRLNPAASAPPSEAEGRELLERARAETRAANEAMPDFVVRQLIRRQYALGTSKNWQTIDRQTVGVSYKAGDGEKYRLLATDGVPTPAGEEEASFMRTGSGTVSTGEYVSMLAALFADESKTRFRLAATDTLRGRRALIYEYEIRRENSKHTIKYGDLPPVVVGQRGRVWLDRETSRVLRIESSATEIQPDYPVTAGSKHVDYAWVQIGGRDYLLPSRAVVEMTAVQGERVYQTRNDIHFRNYQKFGTEIRIIEEDIVEDEDVPAERKP